MRTVRRGWLSRSGSQAEIRTSRWPAPAWVGAAAGLVWHTDDWHWQDAALQNMEHLGSFKVSNLLFWWPRPVSRPPLLPPGGQVWCARCRCSPEHAWTQIMKLSQLSSCGQGYKTWQQHNTDTPAAARSSSSRVNSVVVLPMLYNEHLCGGRDCPLLEWMSYVCVCAMLGVWWCVMCVMYWCLVMFCVTAPWLQAVATQCLTQISAAACGRREGGRVLWRSEPVHEISRQFSQYSEKAFFKHRLLVEST